MNETSYVSRTPEEQLQLDAANELEKRTGKATVVPFAAPKPSAPIPVMAGSSLPAALPVIPKSPQLPQVQAPFGAGKRMDFSGGSASPVIPGTTPRSQSESPSRFNGPASQSGFAGAPQPDHFLSDLYKKRIEEDEAKKWNPEGKSFLQKFGHGLATAGNIAGDIFAPQTMAIIPGTQLHSAIAERNAESAYERALKGESENALQGAETANQRAEATARLNPKPKLLSGEENIRTDAQGNREQAYEMPDGSKQWVSEGQAPRAGAFAGGAAPSVGFAGNATPGASSTIPGTGARYTYGKPTVQDKTEEDRFVSKYLTDKNLSDTAENRLAGVTEFKNGAPIGDDDAKQLSSQIANVLKGTGIDASGYAVSGKSTRAEANEALKAAQSAAQESRQEKNAARVANAPEAAQERKDARMMGYALDKDGNLAYMSKADADKIHSTFEEQKPGEVNKDRQAVRQLNDVQLNTSRYAKASQDYAKASVADRAKDTVLINGIMNKAGVADFNVAIGEGGKIEVPILSSFLEGVSRQMRSKDYEELSPGGKALVDGYYRTMSAIPAYQKALTGIGRSNKEMLDLELANIPSPTLDAANVSRKLGQFQENLDRATEGFPNNLPGLKTTKQVREETEGKKSQDPGGLF